MRLWKFVSFIRTPKSLEKNCCSAFLAEIPRLLAYARRAMGGRYIGIPRRFAAWRPLHLYVQIHSLHMVGLSHRAMLEFQDIRFTEVSTAMTRVGTTLRTGDRSDHFSTR